MATEKDAAKITLTVNLSAALSSALLDSVIFYPPETLVRRMQLGEQVLPYRLSQVRYFHRNVLSMYQGIGMTPFIKAINRSFKFAGEPFIASELKKEIPSANPVLLHTMAGALTGALTALCLTPLDTLKVNKQRIQYSTVSYRVLWQQQKAHPFKATGITLVRNSIGTGAFFTANSLLRHSIFKCQDNEPLSAHQKLVNSTVCPLFGVLAAYPADLVKTHIQAAEPPQGIRETVRGLRAKGGISALYHGLGFRLVTAVPRAAVSYWLYQNIEDEFRFYAETKSNSLTLFFSPVKRDAQRDSQEKAEKTSDSLARRRPAH